MRAASVWALGAALIIARATGSFLGADSPPADDASAPAAAQPTPAAAPAALCGSTGGWRSTGLATKPTRAEDFRPETADYWKGAVVPAAWPALIGVGAAAALLLAFVLWRDPHLRYLTLRWVRCLKVLAVVLAAGVAGGAALGMLRLDAGLVPAGVATYDRASLFLAGVLAEGAGAAAAADAMLGALGEVQGVLDANVNATDISAQLQCVVPLLHALPDPAALGAAITGTNASIGTVVGPRLASASTQLGSLAQRLDPAGGAHAEALLAVADLQALLSGPDSMPALASAVVDAAGALDPTAEDPAAMLAVRSALAALLPLNDTLAGLATLEAALGILDAAATTDGFVPAAAADLAAIRGVALDVAAIAATLRAVQASTAYADARPCMAALLAAAEHINASVLLLPTEPGGLGSKVALLQDAQAALGALVDAPSGSAAALASRLDNAASLPLLDAAQDQLQAAADLRSTLGGVGPAGLAAQVGAAARGLEAARLELEDALAAASAYVAAYAPAGGMPAPAWAALVDGVQAGASALDAAVGQAPANATVLERASELLAQLPGLHAGLLEQQAALGGVQAQLSAAPDLAPLLSDLAELEPSYAELAQHGPSALAAGMQAQLEGLLQGVEQALAEAQAVVQAEVAGVRGHLAEAQQQTVGRMDSLKAEWLPAVRKYDTIRAAVLYALFSTACLCAALLLLAEVFNHPFGIKLMLVLTLLLATLCFVVVTALTAALKAGNDGCVNLEAQILARIPDLLSSPADAAKALAAAQYLLAGQGSLEGVLQAALGFDAGGLQARINATRAELLQEVTERYTLQPLLAAPVQRAVALSYAIQQRIAQLLAMASREQVFPVYLSLKSLVCCRGLDAVGAAWLALLLSASAGVALCLFACSVLAALDKLGKLKGWCACYRRKHFVDEAPFLGSVAAKAGAAAAGGAGGSKAQLAGDARPGSPRMSGAELIACWQAKQGSLRGQFGQPPAGTGSESVGAQREGSSTASTRPSALAPGSPRTAGALSADRSELLGRGASEARGSSGARRGQAGASPRPSGAAASAGAKEAAGRAELFGAVGVHSQAGSSATPRGRAAGSFKSLFKK